MTKNNNLKLFYQLRVNNEDIGRQILNAEIKDIGINNIKNDIKKQGEIKTKIENEVLRLMKKNLAIFIFNKINYDWNKSKQPILNKLMDVILDDEKRGL